MDIIKKTLTCCYNLSYTNKQIYLLDDTRYEYDINNPDEELEKYKHDVEDICQDLNVNIFRRKWRGAKAGIINDFLDYISDTPKEGSICITFENNPPKPKYMTVFDADHTPFPSFLKPLIEKIEGDKNLAFIQTPQHYTNFEKNKVALASGLQQAVFYEYICAGKIIKKAMFCCGTNVIFRIKALQDIGGFDEASVTEDFATSLKLHLKGWNSLYYPIPMAFGMGPENLESYFQQQNRWALGTISLLKRVTLSFIYSRKRLNIIQWCEYFLSCTHYFVGFTFLIFNLCPLLYIFLNIPIYLANPEIFFLFFTPYIAFTLATFYITLARRQYSIPKLILGQFLLAITFPIYIKASIAALLGKKTSFVVTNKGEGKALGFKELLPQLTLIFANVAAIT